VRRTAENRNPLVKTDAEQIAEMFRNQGYLVHVHGTRAIEVHEKNDDGTPGAVVASLWWMTRKGWRLDLAQAIVHTHHDLETVAIDLETTTRALADIEATWNQYAEDRTDDNWKRYQGAVAAHQVRVVTRRKE